MPEVKNSRSHGGPTVSDVAKLAGVSAQTVSRVSNSRTNVDPGTRDRVLAAMKTLGYRPNLAARSLVTARTRNIGLITSTLSSYGTMRTLEAISDTALELGYTITLMPLKLPSAGEVSGAAANMARQDVDGIIVMVESSVLEQATMDLPFGIPVVVTDGDVGHRFQSVDSDAEPGIAAAIKHLVGLGHRSISHVAGPTASYDARIRRELWEAELRAHGLSGPHVFYGDWSARSGYHIGSHLSELNQATAIFAANDQMALGIVRAYADAGKSVHKDLSIVGFDDMTESEQFIPRLTTIRQDFGELGRRALKAVIERIDSKQPHKAIDAVPTVFIERESTGTSPST